MKRLFLCLILSMGSLSCFAKTMEAEPVYSTQGMEVDSSILNSKPSQEDKNEQKAIQNRSKKYITYNKDLERYNRKKDSMQKELEYLEKRLEQKKYKLETMSSQDEKGE